jgi:hypothetical protein
MKKHTLNFFNSRLHSYPRVAFAKLYLSKTAIDLLNDRVIDVQNVPAHSGVENIAIALFGNQKH